MLNGINQAPKIESNYFAENSVKNEKGEHKAEEKKAEIIKKDQVQVSGSKEKDRELKLNTYDVESLKKIANHTNDNLRRMVELLINKQGKAFETFNIAGQYSEGKVTAEDIQQAKIAISDEGEFGVEAVSDRLVNFAITLSGGDKGKYEELKSAIVAGFEAAKGAFGGSLPDISYRTYDATMEKLDAWANEE